MEKDVRWEQRFFNFVKALHKLSQAIEFVKSQTEQTDLSVLDEIVREGLIQRFEYTHELAWNVMKDFSEYQGNFDVKGSRDASRQAFKMGLIQDGEKWMAMIKSRNDSSHTYNETTASEIFEQIVTDYFPLLLAFKSKMESLKSENQMDIFKMQFGLKDTVIEQMQAVFAKYAPVEEVIVYGSRAKGNFKLSSDIDLTVKGKNLNLSILYNIENELDDLLLPYTIDLSLFQQLSNPDLVDHIERAGQVFYQKTDI